MVEEVRSDPVFLPRGFVFANTIFFLFIQGVFSGVYFFLKSLEGVRVRSADEFIFVILFCAGLGVLIALPFCLKALYLFVKHGPVASSIKQIGEALVKTLMHIELIRTPYNKLRVKADKDRYGLVSCSLEGGTTYEKSLFLDALQEILGPIDNPRYLLTRKTPLGRLVRQDYHVVPNQIGKKKEYVEFFVKMWKKYVGSTKLIYTRTVEGRKILLKARGHSLSTGFQKRSDRVKSWK